MGDTYSKLKEFDKAVDSYTNMFKTCNRNDLRMQTTALVKIGNGYKAQEKFQYSLYYFEQAKVIADDLDFANIKTVCEFNLASILQHSTQMYELDQAKKFYEKLIPMFEAKIQQHRDEDTFCAEELHMQLMDCYDGIQNVLTKLANHQECLMYAESCRKKYITLVQNTTLLTSVGSFASLTSSQNAMLDMWDMERILRTVNEQNATILYYTILPNALLLWILQPGIGIARFYASKNTNPEKTLIQQIQEIIDEIKVYQPREEQKLPYECENRCLPIKDGELEMIRKKNEKLNQKEDDKNNEDCKTDNDKTKTKQSKEKSPQRKLFDLLLAPVDDFLSKLEENHALVIIPDKVLYNCPIWTAKDWDNKPLSDYFRISVVPSLYLLDKVNRNGVQQMKTQDSLEFDRAQSRLGGIHKILSPRNDCIEPNVLVPIQESVTSCDAENLDPKKTSNPRLLTSGFLRKSESLPTKRHLTSRDSNKTGSHVPKTPRSILSASCSPSKMPNVPETKALRSSRPIGSPTKLEHMVGSHNLNTLTTRTSTNTDITASVNGIPEFKQISDPHKCVVFGNPGLPQK